MITHLWVPGPDHQRRCRLADHRLVGVAAGPVWGDQASGDDVLDVKGEGEGDDVRREAVDHGAGLR